MSYRSHSSAHYQYHCKYAISRRVIDQAYLLGQHFAPAFGQGVDDTVGLPRMTEPHRHYEAMKFTWSAIYAYKYLLLTQNTGIFASRLVLFVR